MKASAGTSKISRALFLTMAVFALAGGLLAQAASVNLSGTVRGTSGVTISKATVTLTNSSTGRYRTTESDEQGRYSFTGVDPGRYGLSIDHPGFRTSFQKQVVITAGDFVVPDVALQAATTGPEAATPGSSHAASYFSRFLRERTIESLPLPGRNVLHFAELSTGFAPGRENEGGGFFKEPNAGIGQAAAPRLSFAGQPELNTMILVDGAEHVQTLTGLPLPTPSQETVQELLIPSNTYASEYGRSSSGFVSLVTKSGSNDVHGSGYFFGANQALSKPYQLNPPDPRLQQNQYGATLGGPIVKDKTFFFANYEGQRRAQTNQYSTVVLNNIAEINAAKATLGLTPENLGLLDTNNYDGFLTKLDHHLTSSNTVSMRYNLLHSISDGFLGNDGRGSSAPSTARNNHVLDQNLAASDNAILRPNLANEARLSWGRHSFNFPSADNDPALEVPDLLLTGKSTSDVDFYRENKFEASDSISYVHGAHQLRLGAGLQHFQDSYQWNLFFPARALFSSFPCFLGQEPACANSFGAPANIAPFNAGLPVPIQFWTPILQGATAFPGITVASSGGRNVLTESVPSGWLPQTFSSINHGAYGLFAQDEWKVTSKLNLSYGLRYDIESYPSNYIVDQPHNGWQPRVGLAYALASKTVLRAGFGLLDGPLVSSVGQNLVTGQWNGEGTAINALALAQQFGYSGLAPLNGRFPVAIQPPILGLSTPQTSLVNFVTTGQEPCLLPLGVFLSPPGPPNFGNCPPGTPPVAFPAFAMGPESKLKIPYSEQANLSVSQEISGGWIVSASYQYLHAIDQGAVSGNLNAKPIGMVDGGKTCYGVAIVAGVCQEPTNSIFPNLATMFYVIDSGGTSVFNGGTAQIEKRFNRGFGLNASYTLSRTISNYESVGNIADVPQSQDRSLERAVSRQSVPQRFTLDLVSAVPSSVALLHDFKFNALIAAQSGQFYNIFAGLDTNGDTNTLNNRPGTLGRDTLKGPSLFSWDTRIARDIHFTERLSGELTFDLFNLTNRVNVSDLNTVCECDLPASSFNSGALKSTVATLNPLFGFDTPRQTLNPFELQYGFKLRF